MSEKSLSQKVVRGGFWIFVLRVVEQSLGFVRAVILARILAPHDFGLMGIALLTMAILETFSETGFGGALIQKKDNTDTYLDAAWTIVIIRGLILFTILYFIAPYAAIFFKATEAKLIIQVLGFSILLQAFTNIGVIYFQKELQFDKEFTYQISGTLADFVVAVSVALILKNVWALVFGLLARNAVKCFVSYFIHPYRPRLSLDLGKTRELFGFGKWILGSSIIIFFLNQGDDIFLGKILGVTILGFYQMAYRISNLPATEMSTMIAQVTFPTYSKLQESINSLKSGFLKALQITTFISVPLTVGIMVLASDFTKIFLGEKWMPMVPAMQVLAVFGLLRSIGTPNVSLFRGTGAPQIDTHLQFARLIGLVILIYPLTVSWGMVGTSLAVLLSTLPVFVYQVNRAIRIINSNVLIYCKQVMPSIVSGLAMGIVLTFMKTLLFPIGLLNFFSLVGIGIVVYLGTAMFFEKTGYGIRPIVQKLLREMR